MSISRSLSQHSLNSICAYKLNNMEPNQVPPEDRWMASSVLSVSNPGYKGSKGLLQTLLDAHVIADFSDFSRNSSILTDVLNDINDTPEVFDQFADLCLKPNEEK